jgi:hypothetical protein
MNESLVIHIGLHKTGTTYLQNVVFPRVLGEPRYVRGREVYAALRDLDIRAGVVNVLSHERLSGSCNPGLARGNFEEGLSLIARVQSHGYVPKIVLVIRRHEDWLRSAFMQEIKKRRRVSGIRISDSGALDRYARSFDEDILSWSRYAELLSSRYELLLLDYDDLRVRRRDFVRAILGFSGVKEGALSDRVLEDERAGARVNLTPDTYATLFASRLYHRSFLFRFLRRVLTDAAGNSRLSRDRTIRFVHERFPKSERLPYLEIQDPALKERLQADWRQTWEFAEAENRILTIDKFSA